VAETGVLPQEQQTKRLTITVSSQGTLFVGAEISDLERLRRIMTEARRDWGEEAEIQIRTDKSTFYGTINPILRMATESGIVNVSFAVTSH